MRGVIIPETKCIVLFNSSKLLGIIIGFDEDEDENYIIMLKMDDEWVISVNCYWSSIPGMYITNDIHDTDWVIERYPELENVISKIVREDE